MNCRYCKGLRREELAPLIALRPILEIGRVRWRRCVHCMSTGAESDPEIIAARLVDLKRRLWRKWKGGE